MKGDLILIILMSFMKKMNKKMTWDPASEELKRLPQINPVEFNHRFNELLEKVSIQNRYATRISHANVGSPLPRLRICRSWRRPGNSCARLPTRKRWISSRLLTPASLSSR